MNIARKPTLPKTPTWIVAVALVATVLVLVGCPKKTAVAPPPTEGPMVSGGGSQATGEAPAEGTQPAGSGSEGAEAKDVSGVVLEFADGTTKTLGDYKGKVVLLDFWATYCKPCIKKLPHLEELQNRYGEDKLVVIAVTLDPDVETALGWAKANNMNLPIAKFTDEMKQVFFGGEETFAIPQARLVDKDGKLVKSWGPDGTVEDITSAVAELLGSSAGE